MRKRIPVSIAKGVALATDCRQVILLAWDGKLSHVVTYGKTVEDCAQAADGGNRLKDLMGWPESTHAQPSRVKKLEAEIASLKAQLETIKFRLNGGSI